MIDDIITRDRGIAAEENVRAELTRKTNAEWGDYFAWCFENKMIPNRGASVDEYMRGRKGVRT